MKRASRDRRRSNICRGTFPGGCGRQRVGHECPGFGVALQPLQIGAHVSGVLVAQVAVLLESLVDDASSLGGTSGVEPHRGKQARVQNGIEDNRRAFAAEGQLAGGHLIEHGAERKQIVRASSSFARACSGDI
jgi:hypothetical protein